MKRYFIIALLLLPLAAMQVQAQEGEHTEGSGGDDDSSMPMDPGSAENTEGSGGDDGDVTQPDIVGELQAGIDTNTQSIQVNAEHITENRESIQVNAGRIADNQEAIVDFGTEVRAGFGEVDTRLRRTAAELRAAESLIQANQNAIAENVMRLNRLGEQADRNTAGVALVLAMSNLPHLAEASRFSIGAGLGTFDGETGVAVGANFRAQERLVIRCSVASSGGEIGAGVGFGYSF